MYLSWIMWTTYPQHVGNVEKPQHPHQSAVDNVHNPVHNPFPVPGTTRFLSIKVERNPTLPEWDIIYHQIVFVCSFQVIFRNRLMYLLRVVERPLAFSLQLVEQFLPSPFPNLVVLILGHL